MNTDEYYGWKFKAKSLKTLHHDKLSTLNFQPHSYLCISACILFRNTYLCSSVVIHSTPFVIYQSSQNVQREI